MSRVIVTGGCGFIGRHLVKALVDANHDVIVIDKNKDGFATLPISSNLCWRENIAQFMVFPPDIDCVFHLAAVSRTVPAIEDPVECTATNVLGTAQVLEAARKAKVKRVVVSSSNVVLAGQTPYRDSKRAVEEMCVTYDKLYDQSVIALRYSNVYGPGIPKGDPAVFAMLRDSFNARGFAEVTGDGEQARDFTHVSDIVAGNICAWKATYRGVVELCTTQQTTINRACELLKIPVKHIADRPGDARIMRQENELAEAALGWKPYIQLEDGIRDIWKF